MTVKALEKKTVADLEKELREKRESIQNMRFGAAGAKSKDTSSAKKTRREIARILTELNGR